MLVASNTYAAQNTGGDFYVIPVPVKVTVVKEVCTGISVGAKAFVLSDNSVNGYVGVDEIFSTTSGRLVQITGITGCSDTTCRFQGRARYDRGASFRVAPTALPAPNSGSKGVFYYLADGGIAYAKYL